MPLVTFAPQIAAPRSCSATASVSMGLLTWSCGRHFLAAPMIERYVLDEQGAVRKHVAVFVNNQMIARRNDLRRSRSPRGDAVGDPGLEREDKHGHTTSRPQGVPVVTVHRR